MSSVSRLPSMRRTRPGSTIEQESSANQIPSNGGMDAESTTKTKRRSLLPQFHRKAAEEERHEPGIKEEDEAASSRTPSEDTHGSRESLGRRGIDEDRRAMPPPSRHSRPTSLIPPRGASQYAKTKSGPTYPRASTEDGDDASADAETARAQSLAALTGATTPATPSKLAMPGSGLQRPTSVQTAQSPRIGGPAIPSRTTSTRTGHAHSRTLSTVPGSTTMTSIAEKRGSTARVRAPSQTDPAAETKPRASPPLSSVMSRSRPTSQMPPQQTSPPRTAAPSKARPTSQIIMPPPARPSFTTYQQHYSPAKTALPKPPVPSSKATKTPLAADEGIDVTFDVAKQQIELLQLSLMHQAAAKCSQEYAASARKKLNKKHTKLRKDYESVRATELVQQHTSNLIALESWCRKPGMLVENLQILSLVYSDLTALIEEGGRHGDVVSMFELWMNEAETPEPGVFVQPLPEDWKAAHASQALKLRSIQRNLRVLPPPSETGDTSSGLSVVLKGCQTLVDGMMKELEIMVKLEKELLAREKTRLEEDIKALVLDDVGMQSWTPAWQRV